MREANKRRWGGALALLLAAGMTLAGCAKEESVAEPEPESAPPQDQNFPVMVEVDGEEYRVEERPRRVVSLSAELTELMQELGEQGLLVGVSDHCGELVEASAPACGLPQQADVQQILALRAQLVLSDAPLRESQQRELEEQGVVVAVLQRPETLEQAAQRRVELSRLLKGSVDGLGDGEEAARRYRESLEEIFAPIQAYLEIGGRRSGVLLAHPDGWMAGEDCLEGELLDRLGVTNLAAQAESWQLEGEEPLAPEVILYDRELDPEEIRQNQRLGESPAVQAGNLIPVDLGKIQRQSSGMVEELARLGRELYPDAFTGNYRTSAGAGEDAGEGGGETPPAGEAAAQGEDGE